MGIRIEPVFVIGKIDNGYVLEVRRQLATTDFPEFSEMDDGQLFCPDLDITAIKMKALEPHLTAETPKEEFERVFEEVVSTYSSGE